MRVRFILATVVFVAGCWVAVFEPFGGTGSDFAAILGFFSLLAVLFYSMWVFGLGYCCFHPYFSKSLNQKPEALTYAGGQAIAAKLDDFDELATEHGVRPLSSFGYKDSYVNAEVDWHSPDAGIGTISWLLENGEFGEAAKTELANIKTALEAAAQSDAQFCFHMKFASGTNAMEHEQREGSYW